MALKTDLPQKGGENGFGTNTLNFKTIQAVQFSNAEILHMAI